MNTQTGADKGKATGDFWLIGLLAAVTAIGPFTLHVLTPALPQISEQFAVSAVWSQPLLSASLIAMALANLAWGPLSDRHGRRPVLIAGLIIAVLGSILAALAPSLGLAVLGRLLQAAGASAGMVLARAVAQDVYGPGRAAGVIGQITAVMVAAPMIAPTLSGMVVQEVGWRGIFWLSAALCAALVLWSQTRLPETAPKSDGATGQLSAMLQGFRAIGGRAAFWRYAGYAACSLAGFYYFVGVTPYVMRDAFGAGPAVYGFYFILLSFTYMATNFSVGRVTARFGSERTMMFGAWLSLSGPLISGALLLGGVTDPLALFAPGMLQSFGAGLAVPNAMAGAVGSAPDRPGAASGLLGCSQFIVAAVTTQLGASLDHSAPLVVPGGMVVMIGAAIAFLVLMRGRSETAQNAH